MHMLLQNAEATLEGDEATSAVLLLSAQDEVERLRKALREQQAVQASMSPAFSTFSHDAVSSPMHEGSVCVSFIINELASPMIQVVLSVASAARSAVPTQPDNVINSTIAALQDVALSYNTVCNQLVSIQAALQEAIARRIIEGASPPGTRIERFSQTGTERTLCATTGPADLLSPASAATTSRTTIACIEPRFSSSHGGGNVLRTAKDLLVRVSRALLF